MQERGNDKMVALWNSDAASAWAMHPDRYDVMLAPFSQLVLEAAAIQPGERVLDVGCGAGALSLEAASAVGPDGSVLGVDVAAPLLLLAERRAATPGSTASFVEADAQEHPFDGPFDVVISRFGVMFFADPVAAFANLLGATKPRGRLAFVCWQPAPMNEWVLTGLMAIAPHVGPPQLPPPGAPGPFALSDAVEVRNMLEAAGWDDIHLDGVTTSMKLGGASTVEEATAFYREDTFGRMLLEDATPAQVEAALSSVRDALLPYVKDDGVRLGAAVWLCTARRPGGARTVPK